MNKFTTVLLFTLFLMQKTGKCICDMINNEVVDDCILSTELKSEIASYGPIANRIINETVYGKFKGTTYEQLANFVDKFGYRYAPSQNLEAAIDYMIDKSRQFNLENVHGELVNVPNWVRGNESAEILQPHYKKLSILGLGGSVGTEEGGITAEAIVVSSFDQLDKIGTEVSGRIVVYAQEYINYGETVLYRRDGASRAAKYGAVAVLIRSVTPFSLNSPHTGTQAYAKNVKKIPTACITVEDAHLLKRIQNRGEKISIRLEMNSRNEKPKTSRNTVSEIRGSENPDKIVIVSGHIDSWDVGQGAMDDGGGVFLAWNSLVILKTLGLRPRRTLRSILWTAEEPGLIGAQAYYNEHKNEFDNINIVMESDEGTFNPLGLIFSGSKEAACIIKEILMLTKPLNTTQLEISPSAGSDIILFEHDGIPGVSLLNENEKYFWFHHTEADTMDAEDQEALDKGTALWATVSYILADLSIDIPRK